MLFGVRRVVSFGVLLYTPTYVCKFVCQSPAVDTLRSLLRIRFNVPFARSTAPFDHGVAASDKTCLICLSLYTFLSKSLNSLLINSEPRSERTALTRATVYVVRLSEERYANIPAATIRARAARSVL